jgi:hypothetical protein
VNRTAENATRVCRALKRFGVPLENAAITGVEFSEAWKNRLDSALFGVPIKFISFEHLIANKQAIGRAADLEQLKQATRIQGKQNKRS